MSFVLSRESELKLGFVSGMTAQLLMTCPPKSFSKIFSGLIKRTQRFQGYSAFSDLIYTEHIDLINSMSVSVKCSSNVMIHLDCLVK